MSIALLALAGAVIVCTRGENSMSLGFDKDVYKRQEVQAAIVGDYEKSESWYILEAGEDAYITACLLYTSRCV